MAVRDAVLLLGATSFGVGDGQAPDEIRGERGTAERKDGHVLDLPFVVGRDVRGGGADLHHGHAHLLFILREHRARARQRLQDHLLDPVPRPVHGLADVGGRGHLAGHQEDLGLQADAGHAHGILDAPLHVHPVLLRDGMHHLPVRGQRDGPGDDVDPLDVVQAHFVVGDRDDAHGRGGPDVVATDTGVDPVHGRPGHELGFLHGGPYRLGHLVDVRHHVATKPTRAGLSHTQDGEPGAARIGDHFTDDGARVRSPDVESGDEIGAHGDSVSLGCGGPRPGPRISDRSLPADR